MNFQSFQHAVEVFLTSTERSPVQLKAWEYIVLNAPPDLLRTLQEIWHRCFPDIRPTHYDDEGNAYYQVDRIAKQLGMTVDEIVEDLPEQCIVSVPEDHLSKVQ